MGVILDTSALVALERQLDRPTLPEQLAESRLWMPAIVWAEALIGVRLAGGAVKAAQRRARLAEIRDLTTIVHFDERIAEHYADIYYECARKGRLIPQNDMAVSATARALESAVLVGSADEAHFRLVKNLEVVVLK